MQLKKKLKLIKCNQKQESDLVCIEGECKQYAFVCPDKNCLCRIKHKQCMLLFTQTLFNTITQEILPKKLIQDSIKNGFNKLIDQLSNLRDKLLLDCQSKLKFLGLNKTKRDFLKLIQENNLSSVTGSQIWTILLHIKSSSKDDLKKIQTQIKQIEEFFKNSTQQILKRLTKISLSIQKLQKISQCQSSQLFKNSKVITSLNQEVHIKQFFLKKQIKSAQLLYRATQNNFSASKVHEKCSDIPHTLLICETEFGKKIGGYTPIPWKKLAERTQVDDFQAKSFIFSLISLPFKIDFLLNFTEMMIIASILVLETSLQLINPIQFDCVMVISTTHM